MACHGLVTHRQHSLPGMPGAVSNRGPGHRWLKDSAPPMQSETSPALRVVREYLAALQAGVAGDDLARFFTPDAIQVELPNALDPGGQTSDLPAILSRSLQGRQVLASQTFEILGELAAGDNVAVEARWTGVLAIPLGALSAGAQMRAHFAMFFETREGLIHRQRNYDCFEKW